ncbi:hypothetical protein ACFV1W_38720 [Kitasatospora sp. NPDC059648]|uniref:hypothetical protein n=1 Tax=Kitasatospora sp. NPDC059648 TaxID=3346894 RepID=UPI0036C9F7B8
MTDADAPLRRPRAVPLPQGGAADLPHELCGAVEDPIGAHGAHDVAEPAARAVHAGQAAPGQGAPGQGARPAALDRPLRAVVRDTAGAAAARGPGGGLKDQAPARRRPNSSGVRTPSSRTAR